MTTVIIETPRMLLRTWKPEDSEAYYRINQDPQVIEHLKGPISMEQVGAFISAAIDEQHKRGYTVWAAELKETGQLMGFIGLHYVTWKSHFTPAVEIAWRLGSQFWGKGYATEGARASLHYAFMNCNLKKIVSFTVPENTRSSHVMEKIGMKRELSGDFAHPEIDPDHRLSRHILYSMTMEEYLKMSRAH